MSIYQKFFFFALGLLITLLGFSIPNIVIEIIVVLIGLYLIISSFTGDIRFVISSIPKSKTENIEIDLETPSKKNLSKKEVSKSNKTRAKSVSKKTSSNQSSKSVPTSVKRNSKKIPQSSQSRSKTTTKKSK